MGLWAQLAAKAGETILGAVWDRQNEQHQINVQTEKAKELTSYNKDKQLELWEDTGAAAQVKQLQKAGLSTGLMYGGSGAGGQTASLAASSGHSAQRYSQNNLMLSELMNQEAERELIKAQTEKTETETDVIGGVNKDKTIAETKGIIQNIENDKVKKILLEAEAYVKNNTLDEAVDFIKWNTGKALAEYEKSTNEAYVSTKTREEEIEKIKLANAEMILRNKLTIAQTDAVKENVKAMWHNVKLNYSKTQQGWEALRNSSEGTNIQKIMNDAGLEQRDQEMMMDALFNVGEMGNDMYQQGQNRYIRRYETETKYGK